MPPTTSQKADRLLAAGHVTITDSNEHTVRAVVRGDHDNYLILWDGEWSCTCPFRHDNCSHLIAVRRVVAAGI